MPERSLILGGSGAIGTATATRLALRGDRVALIARDESRLALAVDAVRSEAGEAFAVGGDVRDRTLLGRAIDAACDRLEGLDHLIFAAGRLDAPGPMTSVDPLSWRGDLETTLIGFFNAVRLASPYLERSETATINVLVGPGHHVGIPNASGYAAAQAGVVRAVEGLATELLESDIRVYAIFPGVVPSRFTRRLIDTDDGRACLPWVNEAFAEGKEVGPERAAEMIHWLTSRRPVQLNGRVVFAPMSPELMEARLDRIEAEDLNRLRLK